MKTHSKRRSLRLTVAGTALSLAFLLGACAPVDDSGNPITNDPAVTDQIPGGPGTDMDDDFDDGLDDDLDDDGEDDGAGAGVVVD